MAHSQFLSSYALLGLMVAQRCILLNRMRLDRFVPLLVQNQSPASLDVCFCRDYKSLWHFSFLALFSTLGDICFAQKLCVMLPDILYFPTIVSAAVLTFHAWLCQNSAAGLSWTVAAAAVARAVAAVAQAHQQLLFLPSHFNPMLIQVPHSFCLPRPPHVHNMVWMLWLQRLGIE